jgi:TonB family protein
VFRILKLCASVALVVVIASATPGAQDSGAGPLERTAKPNTADNPVPCRTFYVAPQKPAIGYPPLIVALRVALDDGGRVGEVRALGPPRESYSFYVSQPIDGDVLAFPPVLAGRQGNTDYQAVVNAAMDAVRLWQYCRPANGAISFDVMFGFAPSMEARVLSDGLAAKQGVAPRKVKDVAPIYPPIDQSARVQGRVIVEAQVEPDGHVSNARAIRSIPLLDKAAVDAVMQWQFSPTLVNGKPVSVVVNTVLTFTLMF